MAEPREITLKQFVGLVADQDKEFIGTTLGKYKSAGKEMTPSDLYQEYVTAYPAFAQDVKVTGLQNVQAAASPKSSSPAPPPETPKRERHSLKGSGVDKATTPLLEGAKPALRSIAGKVTGAIPYFTGAPKGVTDFSAGFGEGLADAAVGLSSPVNLMMILGTAGLPAGLIKKFPKSAAAVKAIAGGTFGLEQLSALGADLPEVKTALDKGDYRSAGAAAARSIADAYFAYESFGSAKKGAARYKDAKAGIDRVETPDGAHPRPKESDVPVQRKEGAEKRKAAEPGPRDEKWVAAVEAELGRVQEAIEKPGVDTAKLQRRVEFLRRQLKSAYPTGLGRVQEAIEKPGADTAKLQRRVEFLQRQLKSAYPTGAPAEPPPAAPRPAPPPEPPKPGGRSFQTVKPPKQYEPPVQKPPGLPGHSETWTPGMERIEGYDPFARVNAAMQAEAFKAAPAQPLLPAPEAPALSPPDVKVGRPTHDMSPQAVLARELKAAESQPAEVIANVAKKLRASAEAALKAQGLKGKELKAARASLEASVAPWEKLAAQKGAPAKATPAPPPETPKPAAAAPKPPAAPAPAASAPKPAAAAPKPAAAPPPKPEAKKATPAPPPEPPKKPAAAPKPEAPAAGAQPSMRLEEAVALFQETDVHPWKMTPAQFAETKAFKAKFRDPETGQEITGDAIRKAMVKYVREKAAGKSPAAAAAPQAKGKRPAPPPPAEPPSAPAKKSKGPAKEPLDHVSTGSRDPKMQKAFDAFMKAMPNATLKQVGQYMAQKYPAYKPAAFEELYKDRVGKQGPVEPPKPKERVAKEPEGLRADMDTHVKEIFDTAKARGATKVEVIGLDGDRKPTKFQLGINPELDPPSEVAAAIQAAMQKHGVKWLQIRPVEFSEGYSATDNPKWFKNLGAE